MLVNNCFRLYYEGMVEGTAHALLPRQWNAYRQFEKFIMPDMASAVLKQAADPVGFYLSRCYHPPIEVGEGSWRPQGDGSISFTGYAAVLGSIDLTGDGDFAGAGQKLVVGIIALTGTGTFTGSVVGDLNASFDLTGTGDFSGDMAGIASALLDLVGTGGFDGDMNGIANASIDIVVTGTGLTTANVAQAVWSALATSNNDPGTMGELLNNSGAGANPWTVVLEGAYTAAELMRLIAAAAAGKTSGQVGSPVFRSVDDSADRITATVDASGNRISVTLNP